MQQSKLTKLCILMAIVLWTTSAAAIGRAPLERGDRRGAVDTDAEQGTFDGLDRQQRLIWIGDYLYRMHPRFRVVGNGTKLGSLSAIKLGETVEFKTLPNPREPHIPLLVEIRRR